MPLPCAMRDKKCRLYNVTVTDDTALSVGPPRRAIAFRQLLFSVATINLNKQLAPSIALLLNRTRLTRGTARQTSG